MNLSIRFLAKYPVLTESDIRDINVLLQQLLDHAPEVNLLIITEARNSGAHIAVMRDFDTPGNRIVGMATLVEKRQLMGYFGLIEDVVVHNAFRGRGVAEALNRCLINKARELGMQYLTLTSDSSRVEANKLYDKLGYVDRDTRLRRLILS